MADKVTVLRRAQSLDVAPQFNGYSKVIIHKDDETQVSAGDDSGQVLEFDNPLGTQEMANNILEKLRGYQYQPYKAENVMLDPAAEIGDGVSIKDIYGGIYKRSRTFSRLMGADISAPAEEEVDHEYKYESPKERKYKREMGDVRATLIIHTTQIEAKVEKTGHGIGEDESFSWSLLSNEFSLSSGSKKVFVANKDGIEISGRVNVTSGTIGNGGSGNGFTITATSIYNNISEFGGTQSTGLYLGTNGIQLGQNFKVDSGGNLTARTGTFGGQTYAGNISLGGGGGGTMGGGLITGGSIEVGKLDPDGQAAIAAAKVFDKMRKGLTSISNVICNTLHVDSYQAEWKSRSVLNSDGNAITIRFLGRDN